MQSSHKAIQSLYHARNPICRRRNAKHTSRSFFSSTPWSKRASNILNYFNELLKVVFNKIGLAICPMGLAVDSLNLRQHPAMGREMRHRTSGSRQYEVEARCEAQAQTAMFTGLGERELSWRSFERLPRHDVCVLCCVLSTCCAS